MRKRNNGRRFEMERIPCDNHIRAMLDPVERILSAATSPMCYVNYQRLVSVKTSRQGSSE
jgi:hypothetical protein